MKGELSINAKCIYRKSVNRDGGTTFCIADPEFIEFIYLLLKKCFVNGFW